jgi:ABC-type uncharacterized transport system ATPase subunit
MVHQPLQLVPAMTVAENVTLDEENQTQVSLELAAEEGRDINGIIRLIWGVLWRALIPLVALAMGLLIGQVGLLIVFVLSTYLVSGPPFGSFEFERLPLAQKAMQAFGMFYPEHPTATQLLIWFPLLLACLGGAATMVLGYDYARKTWRGRQSHRRMSNRVRKFSRQYGLEVDPDALVENLPVGLQQRVEIIKALYRKADILILDEPTAVLTLQESQDLFKIMRQLAAQGVSIIFVSHKLKEVLQISDRIVVMRGGRVVGTATPAESTESSLAAMMVGRAATSC